MTVAKNIGLTKYYERKITNLTIKVYKFTLMLYEIKCLKCLNISVMIFPTCKHSSHPYFQVFVWIRH